MFSLDSREKQILLEVARRSLTAAVESSESLDCLPQDVNLHHPAGAFVTLRRLHRLRGCIGRISSDQPLIEVVAYCAKAAALEDRRFDPVRLQELSEIRIELSVLSPLQEIVPERVEVGLHGLMVSCGWQRGVLLPQVAEDLRWTAQRFLEETCVKAGLERDAWKRAGTRIQAFTADVFDESEFRASGDMQPAVNRPV